MTSNLNQEKRRIVEAKEEAMKEIGATLRTWILAVRDDKGHPEDIYYRTAHKRISKSLDALHAAVVREVGEKVIALKKSAYTYPGLIAEIERLAESLAPNKDKEE